MAIKAKVRRNLIGSEEEVFNATDQEQIPTPKQSMGTTEKEDQEPTQDHVNQTNFDPTEENDNAINEVTRQIRLN